MITVRRFAFFTPVLLVLLAAAGYAQSGAKGGEQQVLQAEKDRFAAMMKGDKAALERILADDLTYTHTNALFQTKAEFIGSVTAGTIDYVSVVPSEPDWKVRIDGTYAIVNGVAAVNVIDRVETTSVPAVTREAAPPAARVIRKHARPAPTTSPSPAAPAVVNPPRL